MELQSERCIVSLLDRVVEVKPRYILLLSETQSLKGHLNRYIMLVCCKTPIEGEELFLKLEVLSSLWYMISFIFYLDQWGVCFYHVQSNIYIYIYIYTHTQLSRTLVLARATGPKCP